MDEGPVSLAAAKNTTRAKTRSKAVQFAPKSNRVIFCTSVPTLLAFIDSVEDGTPVGTACGTRATLFNEAMS